MTQFNPSKPLDNSFYQTEIDKPFLISTGILTAVGLAIATIGGLALAGVYYPHVNVLGTLALMSKGGAIGMIAGGCSVMALAITVYFCRNKFERKIENKGFESSAIDPNPTTPYILEPFHTFTSNVLPEKGKDLSQDIWEHFAFKAHCKSKIREESLVSVLDSGTRKILYFVHVNPSTDCIEFYANLNDAVIPSPIKTISIVRKQQLAS